MKKVLLLLSLFVSLLLPLVGIVLAGEEPTVYVIQKGDTLWGLSDRFIRDPFYWPNLWERNQQITNPHLIYPGQRVRIYPDRIELEPAKAPPATMAPAEAEVVAERSYSTTGGEGFLLEEGFVPEGYVIAADHNRTMVGEGDTVYTDLGTRRGGRPDSRYSVMLKAGRVTHPVTKKPVGYKVIPLGSIRLTELMESSSKGVVTSSYREIGDGAFLLPYRERRRTIPLKAADRDLDGYIVASQTGNTWMAAGDLLFLDLGSADGLQPGNLLHVVRAMVPEKRFGKGPVPALPDQLLGAVVVVGTGPRTATALVVKSVEPLKQGDRVALRKSR